MSMSRHNYKWNINECLSLQREYELLEWPVNKIALKHKRSIEAILYKLEKEGVIENWIDARGYTIKNNSIAISTETTSETDSSEYIPSDSEDEENDDHYVSDVSCNSKPYNKIQYSVNNRISSLEKSMEDVKFMLNALSKKLNKSKC